MIHPAGTARFQRPRQELSIIIQSPQSNQVNPSPDRIQDEEARQENSEVNNLSVMPLVANTTENRAPDTLVTSVMNTTKIEPHLQYLRNDIVSNLRNLALLWAAFSLNIYLLVHFDIPMYLTLSLVVLSEYTTVLRIRHIMIQR
jgi:hypothetical protein